MERWRETVASLLRAYAAVFFCSSPRLGGWFALVTCASPRAALAGAVAVAAAASWGRWLAIAPAGEAHLVNSLLCGLVLGAFHAFDARLFGWLVAVALLITLICSWTAALCWRAGRLPLLSLPFVLASWFVALATQQGRAAALLPAALSGIPSSFAWPWLDGFFIGLGWLLLVPYPFAGALLFVGLVAASRYLALLATAGYVAGQATLLLFSREEAPLLGFNFMLAAMALGGIFAVPGRQSFIVAMLAAALSAAIAVVLGNLLYASHLPLLTLPFIGAVWLWLGALGWRATNASPMLLLDGPSMPEASFERWRLARVRGEGCAADGGIALAAPFFGEWRVTQAFDGRHTHRAAWRHALDFEVFEGNERCVGGAAREDYFCYGAPLLAPVAGQVVSARDDLSDVAPGEVDTDNNWGNHLLLRTAGGAVVLLAHLRQGSLQVAAGSWVVAGQALAACGSSGRAPVPHLHLHVQTGAFLGAPTQPFHLANVLVRQARGRREFRLCHVPLAGDEITAAPRDERLAQAMALPAGMRWRYCFDDNLCSDLQSELTLLGQCRLRASNGASFAFEAGGGAFGGFDRAGSADRLLDMWLLALGLTPFAAAAEQWHDRPSLELLPLGGVRRFVARCLHPLGAAMHSRYQRSWDADENAWRQDGLHRFVLLPGIVWQARTRAWIAPQRGVVRLEREFLGRSVGARLDAVTAVSDPSFT